MRGQYYKQNEKQLLQIATDRYILQQIAAAFSQLVFLEAQ
jgi:hypothetical protein